jgi:hypothetical protein
MAIVAAILDTLATPSTGGVGEVYQRLKNFLETAVVQQAESSLQHRVEASVSTPDCSKAGGGGGLPKGLWRWEWLPHR